MTLNIVKDHDLRAIRAVGPEGEIEGYIFLFGDTMHRDSYDTWVDPRKPPDLALEYLPQPLYYNHGQDPEIGTARIGKVLSAWVDQAGIKFQGVLDKTSAFFTRVVEEINQGLLKTSSGTAAHLAEFDDQGRFVNWPLVDLSLTQWPSESRMPTVSLLRADGKQFVNFVSNPPLERPAIGDPGDRGGANETVATEPRQATRSSKMLNLAAFGITDQMGLDEVFTKLKESVGAAAAKAMVDELLSAGQAAPADPNAPVDDTGNPGMMSDPARSQKPATGAPTGELTAIRAELDELKKKQMTAPPAPEPVTVRTPAQPQVTVSEPRKYWGVTHRDLELGYLVLRSRGVQPSEEFCRVLGNRAGQELAKGDKHLNDPAVRSLLPSTRANEIAISTGSSGGDEWVGIDWSTALWETARADLVYDRIVSKGMIQVEVPPGHESVYVTTQGADPTVYTISQNADVSSGRPQVNVGATRIGTGRQLATPGELGMAVIWSDVFEEDSIIPVLSQYQKQINYKAQETIEALFLNGDVETGGTGNVNLVDSAPGTGLSTPYYIASDGALKYALVTGSSTSVSGGALDETDYRLTVKLMPAAIRAKLANLVFVIDSDTHSASLDIPAIKTDDVKRTNATITSGVMTNIYGIDVLVSGQMALANTAGKVSVTPGNNTLGRILAVYAPYWAAAWKRQVKVETDRDILSGDNILVAKLRLGFVARGAGASTATYNLTVA